MPNCLDCGKPMTAIRRDHAYGYDHGKKITLRAIKVLSCVCGHSEVEIPRMGPLHETIAQALSVLKVKREDLMFFFERGVKGVEDGTWGVTIRSRT